MSPLWKSLVDKISGLFLWNADEHSTQPTTDDIKVLARDAVIENGVEDLSKQYFAAKNSDERRQAKERWEKRMAARKAHCREL
jgi:hypothetical protein